MNLDELDQLERQVEKLPRCRAKAMMEAEILSIRADLRRIYNMEEEA